MTKFTRVISHIANLGPDTLYESTHDETLYSGGGHLTIQDPRFFAIAKIANVINVGLNQ